MGDHEIVAGDASGPTAAFDQYAYEIYAYCRSRLAQEADAETAVQDTLIIASAKLSLLREPGRLRAWLFAVARNECLGRLLAGASPAAEMTHYPQAFQPSSHEAQVCDLVLAALGELTASERELIELNVRHELAGADLASVLGVSRNRAEELAGQARSRFERLLSVLLAASPTLEHSAGPASATNGWDDGLGAGRGPGGPSATIMLGLLVPPTVPASLREQVSHLLTDPSPGPASYRDRVISRSNSFGADGFPVQRAAPAAFTWRSSRAMAAIAAVAVVALAGGGVLAVNLSAGHRDSPPAAVRHSASPAPAGTIGRTPRASAPAPRPAPAASSPAGNQPAGVSSAAAAPKQSKSARKLPSSTPTRKAPRSTPTRSRPPVTSSPSGSPTVSPSGSPTSTATSSPTSPSAGKKTTLITELLNLIP